MVQKQDGNDVLAIVTSLLIYRRGGPHRRSPSLIIAALTVHLGGRLLSLCSSRMLSVGSKGAMLSHNLKDYDMKRVL